MGYVVYLFLKNKNSKDISLLKQQYNYQIKQIEDKNKNIYSQLQQIQVYSNQIVKERDSLAHLLSLKPKNIKEITTINQRVDTVIHVRKDTVIIPKTVDTTIHIVLDTSVNLSFKDTLTYIQYFKPHLFSPDEYLVYIRNSNPAIHIESGSSIVVREKRVWLTIGPSLQYNPFTSRLEPGISIQIPLIKLYRK